MSKEAAIGSLVALLTLYFLSSTVGGSSALGDYRRGRRDTSVGSWRLVHHSPANQRYRGRDATDRDVDDPSKTKDDGRDRMINAGSDEEREGGSDDEETPTDGRLNSLGSSEEELSTKWLDLEKRKWSDKNVRIWGKRRWSSKGLHMWGKRQATGDLTETGKGKDEPWKESGDRERRYWTKGEDTKTEGERQDPIRRRQSTGSQSMPVVWKVGDLSQKRKWAKNSLKIWGKRPMERVISKEGDGRLDEEGQGELRGVETILNSDDDYPDVGGRNVHSNQSGQPTKRNYVQSPNFRVEQKWGKKGWAHNNVRIWG